MEEWVGVEMEKEKWLLQRLAFGYTHHRIDER